MTVSIPFVLPIQSNIGKNLQRKMVTVEDQIKSSPNSSKTQPQIHGNGTKPENLFSPGFRSVAAMAGWDEEALLIASFIVEDTPDRQCKQKKRSDFQSLKTPPSNSRRKRKAQRRNPTSIPATVLDLDEDDSKSKQESKQINRDRNVIGEVEKNKGVELEPKPKQENERVNKERNTSEEVKKNRIDGEVNNTKGNGASSSSTVIPCIDRLREELSCAVCLEICYEPSTTPCGHSFCKKCLRSAADRCGKKCPKCRQLISNGKYCTVNTVLWNTIQLLFPQEVEARKTADSASESPKPQAGISSRTRGHNTRSRVVAALNSPESESNGVERRRSHHHHHRVRSRSFQPPRIVSTRDDDDDGTRTAAALARQDEDAALALRLQREEFMEAFRVPDERGNSLNMARANLRAMASRAINIRIRGRRD